MNRRAWTADPYGELEDLIRQTALEYELMSDYTAFVAVDASQPTSGSHGVTVFQPGAGAGWSSIRNNRAIAPRS